MVKPVKTNSTHKSHGVTVEQQTDSLAAADQDTESGNEEEWDYLCGYQEESVWLPKYNNSEYHVGYLHVSFRI
ncbi:hypothetical protein N7445_007190 [Penicillium cf. griseofulvum]|nr:hypothetical protein N7445_007190 [Penicillium cf. griseofulvum]